MGPPNQGEQVVLEVRDVQEVVLTHLANILDPPKDHFQEVVLVPDHKFGE